MKNRFLACICLILALAAPAVLAAPPTCEASGTILDRDGNPVAGAKVVFAPAGNPETTYDAKTSKKGKYFIPGMFNPSSEGMWKVTIEAEGFLPVEMEVETRNVNRVLIGDVATTKLNPRAEIPEVMIRPMGTARIDFTVAPAAELAQAEQARQAAPGEPGAAAPVAPKRDPWDAALSRVSAGDLEGSLELFGEAIAEEPEAAERHRALAQVLYQLGRYDDAEAQALRAVELDGGDVDGYMVLYTIYVGKSQLAEAEQALRQARAIAPDDRRILQQLAYVAGESGDTAAAIEAYEALTAADPADTQGWLALADLYAGAGQMDKSAAAYEKVVQLDSNEAPQVFFNLGALLMNKPDRSDDDTRRAIAAFREAVKLDPDYREAHKQLAFALLGTGDRAGAKAELETCLKLAPQAPDSKQMSALIRSLE